MAKRVAEIRAPRRICLDVFTQALKLSATDVFQSLAIGMRGCRLIQVDRNLEAFPDLFANVAGNGHTVFDRDAFDGNERYHVGCANTWMRSLMFIEINEF
jgi:hypothetical protein